MGEPASRDVTHVSLARFSEMAQAMCSTPDRRPFGSAVFALAAVVATVDAEEVIGRRFKEYGFDARLDLMVDALSSPRTRLLVPFVSVLVDLLERVC